MEKMTSSVIPTNTDAQPHPLNVHILHYRSPWRLEKTLLSLESAWKAAEYPLAHFEIHVLDNGSLPAEADLVQNLLSSRWGKQSAFSVFYHRQPVNKGFAAGHNELLRRANPQGYVLFLNSDVEVSENFFNKLRPYLKCQLSKKFLFVPKIVEDGKAYLGGRISYLRATGLMTEGADSKKNFVSGCALMVPTLKFSEEGSWNEDFFFYGEDVDLSHRLLVQKDWQLLTMPDVVIEHEGKGSIGGINERSLYLHFRSRALLLSKTFQGLPFVRATFLRVSLEVVLKMLFFTLTLRPLLSWAAFQGWFAYWLQMRKDAQSI